MSAAVAVQPVPAEDAARRVLVVGAESGAEALAEALRGRGFGVERVEDTGSAVARLHLGRAPALVASLIDGRAAMLELAEGVHRHSPATRVLLAAASGPEESWPEPVRAVARRIDGVGIERLVAAIEAAAAQVPAAMADEELIASDPKMQAVLAQAARAARSSATILIEGESGCGKEVVARAIHRLSARRDGPFVAVNCAALPEGLVESELFGHEKGAFTGAVGARLGRFEAASGGTLLLDEIGEMPLGLQAKMLRVLQERVVERVGGSRSIAFDVRVIATTNRSLEEDVARGGFRLDLFYRLAVLRLSIPPLRERPLDVPALARAFLPPGRSFSVEAQAALRRHPWPGNVRELANVVERAAVLVEDEVIGAEQLGLNERGVEFRAIAPRGTLEEVEQLCIRAALEECGGNRTRASCLLGISIRTLRNRLAAYRLAGIAMPAAKE